MLGNILLSQVTATGCSGTCTGEKWALLIQHLPLSFHLRKALNPSPIPTFSNDLSVLGQTTLLSPKWDLLQSV